MYSLCVPLYANFIYKLNRIKKKYVQLKKKNFFFVITIVIISTTLTHFKWHKIKVEQNENITQNSVFHYFLNIYIYVIFMWYYRKV